MTGRWQQVIETASATIHINHQKNRHIYRIDEGKKKSDSIHHISGTDRETEQEQEAEEKETSLIAPKIGSIVSVTTVTIERGKRSSRSTLNSYIRHISTLYMFSGFLRLFWRLPENWEVTHTVPQRQQTTTQNKKQGRASSSLSSSSSWSWSLSLSLSAGVIHGVDSIISNNNNNNNNIG